MKPTLNLVVLRSKDMARLAEFYMRLGLPLTRHRHGNGPEHFGTETGALIFEIYPQRNDTDETANVRLGFRVESIETTLAGLQSIGFSMVSEPKNSPWGKRCVIDDIEGHRIELTEALPS